MKENINKVFERSDRLGDLEDKSGSSHVNGCCVVVAVPWGTWYPYHLTMTHRRTERQCENVSEDCKES